MKLKPFIEKNFVAIMIWLFGLAFAGINMWQTSQLNAGNLLQRVEAVEKEIDSDNEKAEVLLPQFYQMQQKLDTLIEKVDDNKEQVDQDFEEIKIQQKEILDHLIK